MKMLLVAEQTSQIMAEGVASALGVSNFLADVILHVLGSLNPALADNLLNGMPFSTPFRQALAWKGMVDAQPLSHFG